MEKLIRFLFYYQVVLLHIILNFLFEYSIINYCLMKCLFTLQWFFFLFLSFFIIISITVYWVALWYEINRRLSQDKKSNPPLHIHTHIHLDISLSLNHCSACNRVVIVQFLEFFFFFTFFSYLLFFFFNHFFFLHCSR